MIVASESNQSEQWKGKRNEKKGINKDLDRWLKVFSEEGKRLSKDIRSQYNDTSIHSFSFRELNEHKYSESWGICTSASMRIVIIIFNY